MSYAYVGGEKYESEHLLKYLLDLMKRFPDMKAKEILRGFFIPNDKALADAQEEDRVPTTMSEVMGNVIWPCPEGEPDIDEEPCDKYGLYRLMINNHDRDGHHRPHHVVVIANSANQARSVAANGVGKFEVPHRYQRDGIWQDADKVSCGLLFPFMPIKGGRCEFSPRVVCASDVLNYKLSKRTESLIMKQAAEKAEKKYAKVVETAETP